MPQAFHYDAGEETEKPTRKEQNQKRGPLKGRRNSVQALVQFGDTRGAFEYPRIYVMQTERKKSDSKRRRQVERLVLLALLLLVLLSRRLGRRGVSLALDIRGILGDGRRRNLVLVIGGRGFHLLS